MPAPHADYRPPPQQKCRSERTLPADPDAPLGRISLELARVCNLRCVYCYSDAQAEYRGGLTDDEVRCVIEEAVACGARAISIVAGGESLLRRSILRDGESCIDLANGLGAYTYLYTNGVLMTRAAARWLHARDVTVVGKLNSLRDEVQDALAGVPGSSVRIRRGIDALLAAGFADETPTRLGLETVICRQNYDELPELWRFMRDRNIVPEVEIPTQHGRAEAHRDALYFDPREASERYRALFEELLAIDRAEYGYDWVPRPPFAAGTCQLYTTNAYVNDQGGVQPCAGVDEPYGFLRVGAHRDDGAPLHEIVTSDRFRALRQVYDRLGGACGECPDREAGCYGCRAAAFHATGDVFGEDPMCWRRPDAAARFKPVRCGGHHLPVVSEVS